jgi:hypothetical protein
MLGKVISCVWLASSANLPNQHGGAYSDEVLTSSPLWTKYKRYLAMDRSDLFPLLQFALNDEPWSPLRQGGEDFKKLVSLIVQARPADHRIGSQVLVPYLNEATQEAVLCLAEEVRCPSMTILIRRPSPGEDITYHQYIRETKYLLRVFGSVDHPGRGVWDWYRVLTTDGAADRILAASNILPVGEPVAHPILPCHDHVWRIRLKDSCWLWDDRIRTALRDILAKDPEDPFPGIQAIHVNFKAMKALTFVEELVEDTRIAGRYPIFLVNAFSDEQTGMYSEEKWTYTEQSRLDRLMSAGVLWHNSLRHGPLVDGGESCDSSDDGSSKGGSGRAGLRFFQDIFSSLSTRSTPSHSVQSSAHSSHSGHSGHSGHSKPPSSRSGKSSQSSQNSWVSDSSGKQSSTELDDAFASLF